MPLQHGGLALKNKDQFKGTNKTEKYAKAFTYMIQNAKEIKCISYDSLAGYIFTIEINEQHVVFLGLNDQNVFDVPVTKLLVKIVLISHKRTSYISNIGKNIGISGKKNKITITEEDFEKEKQIQLDIYDKTLKSNNIPISPSIIYYDVIQSKKNSDFLNIFYNKITEKYESTNSTENKISKIVIDEIIKYKEHKSSNFDVGVIGMEYANGYNTFNNYLKKISETLDYNSKECDMHCRCIANIIINIIRLFISTGVIHMDLHVNNIMVNVEQNKSLLIDFGFYKKIIDTKECQEDIDITHNSIIYKKVIKKGTVFGSVFGSAFGSTIENIMGEDAIVKFLKLKLGESYNNITYEQSFMQTYLFGMNDEMRTKKIIKLFILIIMCDLNLNNIRLETPIIMMRDFLIFLGFKLTTKFYGDIDVFSSKYINEIDNNSQPLEDWISENINQTHRSFFEIIFTEVFTKIKEMYIINEVSIFRIGYTPSKHKALKKTYNDYTYGKKTKQLPEPSSIRSVFDIEKGGNQTKYKRKRNSKIKKHKRTNKTKKNV